MTSDGPQVLFAEGPGAAPPAYLHGRGGNRMRHMTEGPGQQPPRDPRTPASDGPREVLEGRVIPSRASAARAEGSYGAHPPVTGPEGGYGAQGGAPGPDYGVRTGAPGPGAASSHAWSQPAAVPGDGFDGGIDGGVDGGQGGAPADPRLPSGTADGSGTWATGPDAPAAMGADPGPRMAAPEAHTGIPQQPGPADEPQGAWGRSAASAPVMAATGEVPGHQPQGGAPTQPGWGQSVPQGPDALGHQPHGGAPGAADGFGPGAGFPPPQAAPQAPQAPQGAVPEQPGPAGPGGPQAGALGSGPGFGPGGAFGSGSAQAAAGPHSGPGGPGGEPPQEDSGFGPNGAFGTPPAGSRSPLGSGGPSFPRQQRPSARRGGPSRPAADSGQGGPAGPGGARKPAAEPAAPNPGPSQTPDWGALADQAASGARRKRVVMLVGGIVAVAVVAGGVATAVVMSGKSSDHPSADPSASGSTASEAPLPPQPSFSSVAPPPPANPLDYISTAAKDTAPITAASLFPGKQFVWSGRTYVKTNSAVSAHCSAAAGGSLSGALAANGCTKMVRATYTQGALAVTIGIAVFSDQGHASKLHGVAQYVAPLNGGGVADFCHAVACQMTSNYVGRYAYFAISGYKNGKTLPGTDTVAKQAANDASDFAFQRIIQRGKDAAQAQANQQ